ncbi:MAG TPA: hypothetical protein VKZ53_17090 [Candidatus Angelobacter sp.]|nr:hypothetical protein [Candidatus Angelobacter sp.]
MYRVWIVATAWLLSILGVGSTVLIPRNVSAQDQPSLQQFVASYENLDMRARMNIPATNARVRIIWSELAVYSRRQFPVLPSEDFNAGHVTPSGVIFLDLSIAATPSVEVTRFFMAHEWGHLMHGDLIAQMSSISRFKMMLADDTPATKAASAETNADSYAATFMRRQGHDIKPVLEFLCSIPDTGSDDPHGTGLERAKHVARVFGSPGQVPPVPCDPSVVSPLDRDDARVARIKSIVTAAGNDFQGMLKNRNGDQYDATITMPGFNNHEVTGFCHVPSGDVVKECTYSVRRCSKGVYIYVPPDESSGHE